MGTELQEEVKKTFEKMVGTAKGKMIGQMELPFNEMKGMICILNGKKGQPACDDFDPGIDESHAFLAYVEPFEYPDESLRQFLLELGKCYLEHSKDLAESPPKIAELMRKYDDPK